MPWSALRQQRHPNAGVQTGDAPCRWARSRSRRSTCRRRCWCARRTTRAPATSWSWRPGSDASRAPRATAAVSTAGGTPGHMGHGPPDGPDGHGGLQELVELDRPVLVRKVEIDAVRHLLQVGGAPVHAVLQDQLLQVEERPLVVDLNDVPRGGRAHARHEPRASACLVRVRAASDTTFCRTWTTARHVSLASTRWHSSHTWLATRYSTTNVCCRMVEANTW